MSVAKGYSKFSEFFKTAHAAAAVVPFAGRFQESSTRGDREGMIKVLMGIPCIGSVRIDESYTGKDDVKAAELYGKSRETVNDDGVTHEEEDCARYWYNSKAFVNCLRCCECMLALPAKLYDKTTESVSDFLESREACMHLEKECSKRLKASASRGRNRHRKCNSDDGFSSGNRDAVVPVVDGKRHAVLQASSDALALRINEKRGRHLVATRNIKAGSVLIVERPFSFSTNKEALKRNCLHCHVTLKLEGSVKIPCHSCRTVSFCSENCRREAWRTYHRYECSVLNAFYEDDSVETQRQASHLLLAYRTTIVGSLFPNAVTLNNNNAEDDEIPFLDDNFLRYHAANINKEYSELGSSEVYSPRDYRTVLELETHCATLEPNINLVRAIEAIFLAKCFTFVLSKMDVVCSKETFTSLAVAMLHHLQAVNCNAYEIVENVYDKETHAWEPRHVGGAMYPSVSLVNHSCYPNVVRHSYPSGIVVVRTLRFIGKGSEILDCYGPHFLSEERLRRREYLWKKYRFLCACEACTQNWQNPLPKTMNYKCKACSEIIDAFATNEIDERDVLTKRCHKCDEKIDCRKINGQLRKSVERRLIAISKMYEGQYIQALPLLLEHVHFIEKFFAAPNIETIKTQQCIIQCYNQFGCTSQ